MGFCSRWPLAILLLPATASAADLAAWMTDPGGHPNPDYPSSGFYCDAGSSKDGQDAARQSAIGGVGRQIRSEVSTKASVDIQRQLDSGGVVVSGGTSSSQSIRVETYFQRADLIKIVGEQTYKHVDYAFACLDRAQAVQSLLHDASPTLARFNAYVQQAQEAWSSKDIAGFTPAYRSAMEAYQTVAVSASIINTLSGGTSAEAAAVSDGVGWLGAKRSEAIAGVRIALDVTGTGLDSSQKKAVSEQVQTVVSGMGFIVGGRCDSSSKGVWGLSVQVDPTTQFTSFGRYVTQPRLALSLRDCARKDAPLTGLVEQAEMKAMSEDEAEALSKALATITSARISPGVVGLFTPVFPVEL